MKNLIWKKNICDNCGQEFKIHQINGVCGDVYYGLTCGCMRIGMNPYEGDEYGYIGIEKLIKEYRRPTVGDQISSFFKKLFKKS